MKIDGNKEQSRISLADNETIPRSDRSEERWDLRIKCISDPVPIEEHEKEILTLID